MSADLTLYSIALLFTVAGTLAVIGGEKTGSTRLAIVCMNGIIIAALIVAVLRVTGAS